MIHSTEHPNAVYKNGTKVKIDDGFDGTMKGTIRSSCESNGVIYYKADTRFGSIRRYPESMIHPA